MQQRSLLYTSDVALPETHELCYDASEYRHSLRVTRGVWILGVNSAYHQLKQLFVNLLKHDVILVQLPKSKHRQGER